MWLRDETCEEVVANNWFSPPTGNPHEQIHLRLKKLRQELRKWNKQTFGWCHSKIKSIENAIKDVQMKDQSVENLALEEALQVELDEQYKRVEVMWKTKAKQRWLQDGDANTRFFHLSTVFKARSNRIHAIKRTDGSLVHSWEEIGNEFLNYYSQLFSTEFGQNSHPFPPDLESLIPQVVSEEDNVSLCENPTADEIKSVVFEMAPFKSPGPDGFPPSFFKNFWHIVGTDVVKAVQHFFLSGSLLKALNHTFITLIPKNDKASSAEQYRPISFCNVTYKIISKILAKRIKPLLDKIISPFQMAFVPGRTINENSIISHEIMHYMLSRKGKKGFMAIKMDLSKAYDQVEWPLLLQILSNLGFNSRFTSWIKECITTSSFSFLLNGSSFGYLTPTRGIRHGDPLSPYLFIIYAELLSRILLNNENLGRFKGVKISRNSPTISHLCYADDLTIFCRAEIGDAQCIQDCILKYATWSNQAPNPSKSFVHFSSNVPASAKRNILAVLQMPECTHKAVHLGLPFCKPRSRRQAFNHILDKLSGKLSGWKMKNLSQASRGVLIKSVGQALPIYHMSTFLLPKSLCGKMDSTLRKFWWGARQDKKFLALKCWDDICAPKNLGGLGFRKMWEFNKALVSKLAWQMCFPQDKLWSQILGAKYLHFNSFLELPGRTVGASWIWQGIMEFREIIKEGACYHVFANSEIKIWQDPWIPTVQNFLPPEEHMQEWAQNQNLFFVRDLMENDCKSWNLNILHEIFPRCEDSHHLLLECAFTERIWFSSKWKFRLFPFRHLSVSEWFLTITGKDQRFLPPNSTQEEFITFWIAVLDLIWGNRNNILHGKPKMEPDAVARIAHTHTVEHSQAQVLKSLKASSVVFDKWLPPPEGWLKVNTDAAFSDGEGMVACVIRNHEGTIICAKSERIWAHDPTAAEVLVLKSAFLFWTTQRLTKLYLRLILC
ncbi:UNVERIFIED_CONTAM: putative mitochondrial protein [Sesamum radiatum]|uniref:Mitochondrial protein n=1 Tax=Sesamum radiatum TaxID=300843 RepID=A0AAW2K3U8_SESRA